MPPKKSIKVPFKPEIKRVVTDLEYDDFEKLNYIIKKRDTDVSKLLRKYVKFVIAKYKEENPTASIFKND